MVTVLEQALTTIYAVLSVKLIEIIMKQNHTLIHKKVNILSSIFDIYMCLQK
jgi:hypothetical protein